ncbi:MerR family transcriptional regulator [Vallitalea okinawensis]|uniref:MerR family transcriptional regulator n=1 Tax=Vallitalea okinawensis TaxID=2078660 RepID=UPI000CFAE007|nr:MerR family transcriptional regulator [Vallitalea okinawensis]
MAYRVKEVAQMVGISVRTLHYYDEIDLLKPDEVTEAGYRYYSDSNLEVLQQILFFKEMDFNLSEIRDILNDPSFNRKEALLTHKGFLIKKRNRLDRIINNVDKTLNTMKGEMDMNQKDMFDGFDMTEIEKYKEQYREEVREKYDTAKVKECEEKTDSYTKKDWAIIQKASEEITQSISRKMNLGPSHPEIQQLMDDYRAHITRYFYECTPEIFKGLGEMYVADPRFTAYYEKYKEGLATFMKEAIDIYYNNQGN